MRLLVAALLAGPLVAADRPNVLWLTSEDHGPHLGCYGDPVATTPNVDKLAAKGVIYTRVWSNAPVCAPARTTLISGMYPTSTGGEHMRSHIPYPARMKMYPQFLREAGYYCTNNSKEDYNLDKPGQVWDESSAAAHWKKRKPDQPFFAVFNSTKSHESQVRARPHKLIHDPAKVRVPAYHPDTPESRRDWAQYHDGVSAVDADAGKRLQELDEAGLAADTIVFYYADHGPGLPRSKRSPYDSGLHVPLVVYVPEKWKHLAPEGYAPGGKIDRLVSFVDFAPTVLSLAGVKPPATMQGVAFMGRYAGPPQQYAHGFRGRMDERPECVRSVTDGRYVYVRNYLPHLEAGRHVDYQFEMPTTQVWKKLHDEGKLTPAQDKYWRPRQGEELYDLSTDRDEVNDLAADPTHRAALERLRAAARDHAVRIRDVGFIPEGERFARCKKGESPYDMARDGDRYPFDRVFAAAELASSAGPDSLSRLKALLTDGDAAVRYWAATGVLARARTGVESAAAGLRANLADPAPCARTAAAEALARFGTDSDRTEAVRVLTAQADWSKNDVFAVMAALDALCNVGAGPDAVKGLPEKGSVPDQRYASYVPRLLEDLRTGAAAKRAKP